MKTIEEIRTALLGLLDNEPDTIVLRVYTGVVALHTRLTEGMPDGEWEAWLDDLVNLEYEAETYGRIDIANRLSEIGDAARLYLPGEAGSAGACVLSIDFRSGAITGTCLGCDPAQVSDAIAAVMRELQLLDVTPTFCACTADKICIGPPLTER
jgi:hypothetical protein